MAKNARSKPKSALHVCALCDQLARGQGQAGGETFFLCKEHIEKFSLIAEPVSSLAALREALSVERRSPKGVDRRQSPVDRRAFWRPTPDRRREATEAGRRSNDSKAEQAV